MKVEDTIRNKLANGGILHSVAEYILSLP